MVSTLNTDKTSAADKSAGFDFQYYYFLYRLLCLKSNETVGLEVFDDVHTDLVSDRRILVQLKHTVQEKADGNPKNLTTLDGDLWKSLSNWSQIIKDEKAGRKEKNAQLEFVFKTDFLLVSNKSENTNNVVLSEVKKLQSGEIEYSALYQSFSKLLDSCKSETIKGFIRHVLELDKEVGEAFFRSVDFDLGQDLIIRNCKNAIKEKMVPETKIDDVFRNLDSQIRQDNFVAIRNQEKIIVRFDDFYRKYRRYFDLARNESLSLRPFTGILPDRLIEQRFIQQLIDVNDIEETDYESIAEFTRHKLRMQNNIYDWYQEGELTEGEIDLFDTEAKNRWKNKYREVYRHCSEDDIPKRALELLDAMRREKLAIASQDLPIDMSNGQYYRLSDAPEIGWHRDWESKFK